MPSYTSLQTDLLQTDGTLVGMHLQSVLVKSIHDFFHRPLHLTVAALPGAEPLREALRTAQPLWQSRPTTVSINHEPTHALATARTAAQRTADNITCLPATALPACGQALTDVSLPKRHSMVHIVLGHPTFSGSVAWPDSLIVIEPAWPQQVYHGLRQAGELSRIRQQPVCLYIAPALCDAWATFRPSAESPVFDPSAANTMPTELSGVLRRLGLHHVHAAPRRDETVALAMVCAGQAAATAWHWLQRLGIVGRLPVALMPTTQPLDLPLVRSLTRHARKLAVVEFEAGDAWRQIMLDLHANDVADGESKRPCEQVLRCVADRDRPPGVANPTALLDQLADALRGLPAMASDILINRLDDALAAQPPKWEASDDLPPRPGVLPHGSPWRDVMSVLMDLQRDLQTPAYAMQTHRRDAVQLALFGHGRVIDALQTPPFDMLEPAEWSANIWPDGAAIDAERPTVLLLDEKAAKAMSLNPPANLLPEQSLTVIIMLDPASNESRKRRQAAPWRWWRKFFKDLAVAQGADDLEVTPIDAADRQRLHRLLERTVTTAGRHVVVVEKRRAVSQPAATRSTAAPRQWQFQVAESVCEHCLACTTRTGDPALTFVATELDAKVQIRRDVSTWDDVYQRLNACPSFEHIAVSRTRPMRTPADLLNFDDLPEPPVPIHAQHESWRCQINDFRDPADGGLLPCLVLANRAMGFAVHCFRRQQPGRSRQSWWAQLLCVPPDPDTARDPLRDFRSDLTGSRIDLKNTAAKLHASNLAKPPSSASLLKPPSQPNSPMIAKADADVIIAGDLYEAFRALGRFDTCGRDHTHVTCDDRFIPVPDMLMGLSPWQPHQARERFDQTLGDVRGHRIPATRLAERVIGDAKLADAVMLGAMVQQGLLPLRLSALQTAVQEVWSTQPDRALQAVDVGRMWMARPHRLRRWTDWTPFESESVTRTQRRKRAMLKADRITARQRRKQLAAFDAQSAELISRMNTLWTPTNLTRAAVIRLADAMLWGGPDHARRYLDLVLQTFDADEPAYQLAMTRAVVDNLARVMNFKDEIHVAHLLTHPARLREDRQRWHAYPARGDRLIYRRVTRPEVQWLGRRFQFESWTRHWQLRLISRMGWLRRFRKTWHRREREFAAWYIQLLRQASWKSEAEYRQWVAVLSLPSVTTGFRDELWRKMQWARQQAERWLAMDAEDFSPPAWLSEPLPMLKLELPIVSPTLPDHRNPDATAAPETSPGTSS